MWAFEDDILESGANYCVESMNAVDYAGDKSSAKTVMAVHLAGDYGDDAAAGAKIAAEKLGLTFINVKTDRAATSRPARSTAIVTAKPDLVILTTGPTDAAVIVGRRPPRGYKGKFIGTSPTWNPGLLQGARPRPRSRRCTCSPRRGSRGRRTPPATRRCGQALGTSVTPERRLHGRLGVGRIR